MLIDKVFWATHGGQCRPNWNYRLSHFQHSRRRKLHACCRWWPGRSSLDCAISSDVASITYTQRTIYCISGYKTVHWDICFCRLFFVFGLHLATHATHSSDIHKCAWHILQYAYMHACCHTLFTIYFAMYFGMIKCGWGTKANLIQWK